MTQYHGSTRGLGNINRQELNDPLFAWQKGLWAEMALLGGGGIWPLSRMNAAHTQLLDFSGNVNTLTISGAGSSIRDHNYIIPIYSLPGGAVFAAAGAASALNMTTAFSMAVWAKHNIASGVSQYWFSKNNAGAGQLQYSFGLGVNGRIILAIYADGTTLSSFNLDPVADCGIDVTEWNFYACRFQGGNHVRMWVNDQMFFWNAGIPANAFSSTSIFRLGWQVNGGLCLPAVTTMVNNLDALVQVYNQSRPMFGK